MKKILPQDLLHCHLHDGDLLGILCRHMVLILKSWNLLRIILLRTLLVILCRRMALILKSWNLLRIILLRALFVINWSRIILILDRKCR